VDPAASAAFMLTRLKKEGVMSAMAPDATPTPADDDTHAEREQTDASLRSEREKVDDALGETSAVDETADAVINRARAQADEVLAKARAKTDRQSATAAPTAIIEKQRVQEDKALEKERASADEALQEEREEHVALLSIEREETDKDLLSERARADQALATRDEFLGIVSHDLRNILSSVLGFATLIEKAVEQNQMEKVVMHAQRIRRSGARMDRLIGDLVDIASIEAGRLAVTREVGDPTQVVTEAVESFQAQATANGISLVLEPLPPSLLAAFDPARILQVLTNLLSNAVKFTPAEGKVVVKVERIGDELRFAVRDTGEGIPSDKLEAIFERFLQVSTNDRRGLGLGLYISKCIVQGHGGRIWAHSRTGEGSTLFFTLPAHVAARA
jgi:signal transduction histidine kinase